MAKIHTHYDNLKVARLAPQEVIRAAYKALSQKYHPDKNPGDEKAARIMAILNGAYNTLSDPVRRKEHDDWIAAEEWEIEWLESTRAEDARHRADAAAHGLDPHKAEAPAPYQASHDPKWWFGLGACFVAGGLTALLIMGQSKVLPSALASMMAGRPEIGAPAPPAASDQADARPDGPLDNWAVAAPYLPEASGPQAPAVKALGVTQLIVPARTPDCDSELHTLIAPNGEPWPIRSGYVDGYPLGNRGDEMQLQVDNSANGSPVFVKVYDLDRRSNVRHAFVQAHDTLTVDKLAAGKYELRYQNIDVGGTRGECGARRKDSLKQAAAGQPET